MGISRRKKKICHVFIFVRKFRRGFCAGTLWFFAVFPVVSSSSRVPERCGINLTYFTFALAIVRNRRVGVWLISFVDNYVVEISWWCEVMLQVVRTIAHGSHTENCGLEGVRFRLDENGDVTWTVPEEVKSNPLFSCEIFEIYSTSVLGVILRFGAYAGHIIEFKVNNTVCTVMWVLSFCYGVVCCHS